MMKIGNAVQRSTTDNVRHNEKSALFLAGCSTVDRGFDQFVGRWFIECCAWLTLVGNTRLFQKTEILFKSAAYGFFELRSIKDARTKRWFKTLK